ncbi:MAG: isoprenylcysteine carboxylmethyltransferase family protein [Bryobacteraceae bacterium]|jgi:protein-S-isoprenylcysteine O-methyltransferase Ste14
MWNEPYRIITSLWILAGIVWAVAALNTKRTRRREAIASRLLYTAVLAIAFLLVFKSQFRPGILNAFFIAQTPVVEWTGVALTAAGIALAIYARITLGRNWSGMVTLKEDHELIRKGPYALVRHPIYTGMVLGFLGAAVDCARVGALLGVALAMLGLRMKWGTEEQFMVRQFGAEYLDYKRHVKALIPFVW